MREDSRIRWFTLFFLEFHAWSVFVIERRPTRCWVPYHQKHIPDGSFPERTLPQQLLQNIRWGLLLYRRISTIAGTLGRLVRWNRKLRSWTLINPPSSGCGKVGALTVDAIKNHCPNLLLLDMSHTLVTPMSLTGLLQNCRRLKTLKVAGIKNWVRTRWILKLPVLIGLPCRPTRPSKSSLQPSGGRLYLTFKSSNSVNSSSLIHPSDGSLTSVVT